MRLLFRYLLAHPILLFGLCAVAAIGSAIVAFVLAERRAREMAELAQDERAKSKQIVRLVVLGLSTATAIAGAAWWIFVRVHTEPEKLIVVVALDPADGGPPIPWWEDARGTYELAQRVATQLEELGMQPLALDDELGEALAERRDDAGFAETARALEARWVVRVFVRVDKTIPLIGADYADYVLSLDAALIDAETGEVWPIADAPLRAFLWGEQPPDAIELNAQYLADRLALPIVAQLGARPALQHYADPSTLESTQDRTRAQALAPLFARSDDLAKGQALRVRDRETALARESEHRANTTRTRLGDVLAEEYMIGTAFDGRPIMLVDSKHLSVIPGKRGYAITSEGESIELVDLADPSARTLVFEHYNVYGASSVSAEGHVIWTTLANHGASKTLATLELPGGSYAPVYTHPSEYMTSPIPAPDGSRALFYARAGRYEPAAIDVIARDGTGRRRVIETDEVAGVPAWAPDGRSVYLPIGEWERIVAIDMTTLERRHVLGMPPPELAPDPEPDAAPEPDAPSLVGVGLALEGDDVPAAEPAADEDPRMTSQFPTLALGHTGRTLYVVEQAIDGVRWIGRYDLERDTYERLAALDGVALVASPSAERVAVQVRGFTASDDPRPGDDELLVLGPGPSDMLAVTLDSEDDELIGWSRDGASVFGLQRSVDPGQRERPVTRVYRYDL